MKKFRSGGKFVTVVTTKKVYHDVIICPSPICRTKHFLEAYNGDVVEIETNDILEVKDGM